jgi:hypothetical protein
MNAGGACRNPTKRSRPQVRGYGLQISEPELFHRVTAFKRIIG